MEEAVVTFNRAGRDSADSTVCTGTHAAPHAYLQRTVVKRANRAAITEASCGSTVLWISIGQLVGNLPQGGQIFGIGCAGKSNLEPRSSVSQNIKEENNKISARRWR